MNELPSGWAETTIGEISAYVSRGKSPKYTDKSRLPVVNQKSIRWHGIEDKYLKFVHEDQFEQWAPARFIQPGDILWNSTGTGTIGRACLVQAANVSPPKVVDSHVTIVRPSSAAIDPRFLFAWIQSPEVQNAIEELASGSTNQIELNRSTVVGTRVPLAPLPEQKRIADKLDALLARVDACRERLDRVPGILKRFRQSVLAAATSGELTRDWREERGLPKAAYELCPLRDLVREPLRNGRSVRDGDGPLVLRLSSLKDGSIDWREAKSGEWGDIDIERFLVADGDFLVARGNGSRDLVGRGSLVLGAPPRVAFPDTMIRVRPEPTRIAPKFLNLVWDAESTRMQIERSARTTAGIWKVAQPDLEAVAVPLPALNEQDEIVGRTEQLLGSLDVVDAVSTATRTCIERLTPSALAKAFRGELVPQDPNDEPASELLVRLCARAEPTGEAHKPRQKRGTKGRSRC